MFGFFSRLFRFRENNPVSYAVHKGLASRYCARIGAVLIDFNMEKRFPAHFFFEVLEDKGVRSA